ncbi:MAG: class A beta-lactamase [Syntrophobacteraceae bacterium]
MGGSVTRRDFLLGVFALPFVAFASSVADEAGAVTAAVRLKSLEAASGGRLGVAVLHGASTVVTYRGNERFPLCSTLDLSDNTAGNLLMKLVGGPEAVTSFARTAGDPHFRLDRWEPDLNTAIPGDPRDTTTPIAMAGSVKRLALGPILANPQRNELCEWMIRNRIGHDRMRAGAPAGRRIADKTGSGEYGTTNDTGVIWPSSGRPYVLALYYTQSKRDASPRSDVLREATRIVFDGLST